MKIAKCFARNVIGGNRANKNKKNESGWFDPVFLLYLPKSTCAGFMASGGNKINQVAPVVVSASRATDIPAFYAEWFFRRLEAGYCAWVNPFNQKKMYVSFKNCRVVVFWSKNPEPILPYLHKLDERGIHYYFQFTLNDYEQEGFEPNVPELERRIETFRKLAEMIGKERVIWRFDPLIVTPSLSTDMLLARIERIGDSLKGCTEKLVFSFVDVKAYRKVQSNLVKVTSCFTKGDVMTAEPNDAQRIATGPYTHLRAHETKANIVCRLLREKLDMAYCT